MKIPVLKPNTVLTTILLPAFILAFVAAQPVQAQKKKAAGHPEAWPRFTLEAGGYLTNINSNFRLGSDRLGLGLEINFEDALGLNTSSFTLAGSSLYRFSKNRRSAVRAGYFQIVRKATKTLKADLEVGDTVFTAGTTIGSGFNIGVFQVDYCYSFLMDERVNIYGSIGFYVLPISFSVNRDDKKSQQSNFTAPLPVLGLTTLFYLTPKFLLKEQLNLFYFSTSNFEGSMTDIHLALEYHPWTHFAFGLGYNAFSINVETWKKAKILTGDLVGNVGYKQNGAVIYGVVKF